jgi:hypothetical protein
MENFSIEDPREVEPQGCPCGENCLDAAQCAAQVYASGRDGAISVESRRCSEGSPEAPEFLRSSWAVSGEAAGSNLADGTGANRGRSAVCPTMTFAEMGFKTKPTQNSDPCPF